MVAIKGGDLGFDLRQLDFSDLFNGYDSKGSSALFRVYFSNGVVDEFRGSGFRYDHDGVPIGGTVKSYAQYYHGDRIGTIDGLHVQATSIVKVATTYSTADDKKLVEAIMSGSDSFRGGKEGDYINTFAGNDKLEGGGDGDTLLGGSGADTFIYRKVSDSYGDHVDLLGDFSLKDNDRIDLSHVDANGSRNGHSGFHFGAGDTFNGRPGELRTDFQNGYTFVIGDTDGDKEADLVIAIDGKVDLSRHDFIL